MSTSADAQLTEKEVIVNGKSHSETEMPAAESEHLTQCSIKENESSVATQTESLSDWFVMICVLLCNIMNGINYGSYGVLYLPMTEMFQSSRAAVGWIQSFDVAFGSFLGELHLPGIVNLSQFSVICTMN